MRSKTESAEEHVVMANVLLTLISEQNEEKCHVYSNAKKRDAI